MTLQDAQKIKQAIQELCKKHGLWSTLTEKSKPEVKDIEITVSIRVDTK
jgi:hypothetical protein